MDDFLGADLHPRIAVASVGDIGRSSGVGVDCGEEQPTSDEGAKGKQLQQRRSEVVERTFAHLCETGGSRRSHLRGRFRGSFTVHTLSQSSTFFSSITRSNLTVSGSTNQRCSAVFRRSSRSHV